MKFSWTNHNQREFEAQRIWTILAFLQKEISATLPETKTSHMKMWFSQKERMVSQAPFFRGELLVLGRQLTWRIGSEGNTKVKESRKSQSFEDARHKIWGLTLPKTNISPEKWWLEDYIPWLYSVYSWQNAWCLSCPKPPGLIATVHHGSHQARGPYLVEACCSNEKTSTSWKEIFIFNRTDDCKILHIYHLSYTV